MTDNAPINLTEQNCVDVFVLSGAMNIPGDGQHKRHSTMPFVMDG
jgi:hypothetical protein